MNWWRELPRAVLVIGLMTVVLAGGCAKKNVVASSDAQAASAKRSEAAKATDRTPAGAVAATQTPNEGGAAGAPGDLSAQREAPGPEISGKAEEGAPRGSAEVSARVEAPPTAGPKAGASPESSAALPTAPSGGPASAESSAEMPPASAVVPSEPLKGFGKASADEPIKESMMVAKAEPTESLSKTTPKRELMDIYFAFDRWSLSSEGRKNLSESAELLKQYPGAKLRIEGYCDERGTREYNLVLGEKRAKETQEYLLTLGIKNPVKIVSYGKERPICTEQEEPCYGRNRRAHLVLEEGQ